MKKLAYFSPVGGNKLIHFPKTRY